MRARHAGERRHVEQHVGVIVEQFDEESVARGEALVVQYGCYGCHGPDGAGGNASYTEKRTGALVLWAAPSLNDIFYRYDRAEVVFWVTYGRGNSPMPAWGTPGGGPMTSQQVDDVVNYLEKNQISQAEAATKVQERIDSALTNLAGAEAAMETAVITQRQLIADIERAGDLVTIAADIADRAQEILEGESVGIDTDGECRT
mgnify:CR=1 FL=1